MIRERNQVIFYYILLSAAAALSLYVLSPYIGVLVFSLIFAIVFQPLYRVFLKAVGGREFFGALLTVLAIVAVVLVPVTFLSIQVFQEAHGLYAKITQGGAQPDFFSAIENLVDKYILYFEDSFSLELGQYFEKVLNWLIDNISVIFSGIAKVIIELFFVLFTLFYFLKDGKKFKSALLNLSPLPEEHNQELIRKISGAINSVVRGSLLVALIQGFLTIVGFSLFGIPNPVLWGSLAFVAALIPGLGTSLVIVPAIAYLSIVGHLPQAIGLTVWGLLLVGMVDNFLRPMFIGKETKIHPILILFSVIGGIAVFGFVGFLLGPIIIATLFAVFEMHPAFVEGEIKG